MNVLRSLLLSFIALLLVMVVIGAFTGETGSAEKIALAALAAALIYAASFVRRLGASASLATRPPQA
jgi:hypothetical protein